MMSLHVLLALFAAMTSEERKNCVLHRRQPCPVNFRKSVFNADGLLQRSMALQQLTSLSSTRRFSSSVASPPSSSSAGSIGDSIPIATNHFIDLYLERLQLSYEDLDTIVMPTTWDGADDPTTSATHNCLAMQQQQQVLPTQHNLYILVERHVQRIPFENLSLFIANDDSYNNKLGLLNVNQIAHKILIRQRGGLCYELNGLFASLLEQIGYQVELVPAQVYKKRTKQRHDPYDDNGNNNDNRDGYELGPHMTVCVKVPKRPPPSSSLLDREQASDRGQQHQDFHTSSYIVDVGLGESPLSPIQLRLNDEQPSSDGRTWTRLVEVMESVNNNVNGRRMIVMEQFDPSKQESSSSNSFYWEPKFQWQEQDLPISCSKTQAHHSGKHCYYTLDDFEAEFLDVLSMTSEFRRKPVICRLTRYDKLTFAGGTILHTMYNPNKNKRQPYQQPRSERTTSQQLHSFKEIQSVLHNEFGIPYEESGGLQWNELGMNST